MQATIRRQDGGNADTMTDKEMHKLSRRELLQLLLAQVTETEELKQLLAEREDQLLELQENYERLRKRLDQKDAKIQDLKDTLREERTTRKIELQEAGSIAEAALRLNGIFDIAQKAADQYLENIRLLNDRLTAGEEEPAQTDVQDNADMQEPEIVKELPALPERPSADYRKKQEKPVVEATGDSGLERLRKFKERIGKSAEQNG